MSDASLEEDEARLRRYADALVAEASDAVGRWIRASVARFDADLAGSDATDRAVAAGSEQIVAELEELLGADIGDQAIGPLQVLRRGVRFATAVLSEAGVAPVARDEFAGRAFPDDVYDLSPATFGDVDQALHEPGLVWGAAKAHVHLRRRREAAEEVPITVKVVALSADLMDRSKIAAAFPDATFVRSPAALAAGAAGAALVLVDLARVADVDLLRRVDGRVVAFGSHVDDDVLAAAATTGAEALPRSVFFRRLANGDL